MAWTDAARAASAAVRRAHVRIVYHGTAIGNVTSIKRSGIKPTMHEGKNSVYVTTSPKIARWYAAKPGGGMVLKIRMPKRGFRALHQQSGMGKFGGLYRKTRIPRQWIVGAKRVKGIEFPPRR